MSTPLETEPSSEFDQVLARSRPRFRVLQFGGARRGFRLEAIYWDALDLLARRNGRSLAAEVQDRLAAVGEGPNQSAALRSGVTGELLDLWNGAQGKTARPQWAALVSALTVPAFAVNRRSVLLSVNEPLLTYLEGRHEGRGVALNSVRGALELSVEAPPIALTQLATDLERRFVDCSVVFKAGSQRFPCRSRLVPLEVAAGETPAVLGVLTLGET